MRPTKLFVLALAGTVVCACGGSSNDGLFDGKNPSNAAGASAFGGATGSAGRAANSNSNGGALEMANTGGESPGGTTGAGGGFPNGGTNTGGSGFGGDLGAGGEFGSGGFGQGGSGGTSTGGTTQVGDGGGGGVGGAVNGTCPAGDYSGKLKGPYTSSTGTKDIGASITFTVDGTGAITGSFMGPGNAKAKLVGRVDCATGALSMNVQNGTYPVGLGIVNFSGTLAGHYDQATKMFVDGTWDLTERSNAGNGGTGTWATP